MLSRFSCVWLFATLWTGSSVHEILQARVLEWAAVPWATRFSQPRDQTRVSTSPALAGGFPTWDAPYNTVSYSKYMMGQIVLGCFPRSNGHVTAGNVCLQKSLSLWKDSHNTNRKAASMVQMLQRRFMKISVQQTEHSFEISNGFFGHMDHLPPTPANISVFWVYTWVCLQVVL